MQLLRFGCFPILAVISVLPSPAIELPSTCHVALTYHYQTRNRTTEDLETAIIGSPKTGLVRALLKPLHR